MLNLTKGHLRNGTSSKRRSASNSKEAKKLQQNPYVESARLHGDLAGCFKIKLRASGFRLIYKVIDDEIVIWVVAVGKREDEKAYETARKRLL